MRIILSVVLGFFSLAALSSSAHADPLTTFTLTDLGPGTPTFATGANGNGIVFAGNGQTAYSFQKTQDTSLSTQQALSSGFPLDVQPSVGWPMTYGFATNAYSIPMNVSTNGDGTYIAIDAYGVYGHQGFSTVYYATQNPDGTWSKGGEMWQGGTDYGGSPSSGQASITGINRLNEVLGLGSYGPNPLGSYPPRTYLYNISTNSLLNLSTLNVLASWSSIQPLAIDDQGRILLQASPNPTSRDQSEHNLLLTPEGVASTPLELTAPEPGALAIAVVTIAALAVRRAVRSRA